MYNQQTLFFIVVPVYKAEFFLENCVKSVLNQTYSNWQLILVDDGSPDKSGEMCDFYAQKYEQIHVIHQLNQGQIAARTTGNQFILDHKVDNSYAVYLDSDDTLELHALEKIAENIKLSNAEIIFYNWQRVENGKKIIVNKNPYQGLVKDKGDLYKIVFSNAFYNSLCIKSIATSLICEEHYEYFYHVKYGEDLVQSISYYKNCNSVLFTDDILYNYTVNINSVTQTISYENYRVNTTVRRMVWDFLKKENVWTDNDFKQYVFKQSGIIKSQVKTICRFDIKYKNKIELLEKLRSDCYFEMILSYPIRDFVVKMFKYRSFHALLLLSKIYIVLSSLKLR